MCGRVWKEGTSGRVKAGEEEKEVGRDKSIRKREKGRVS